MPLDHLKRHKVQKPTPATQAAPRPTLDAAQPECGPSAQQATTTAPERLVAVSPCPGITIITGEGLAQLPTDPKPKKQKPPRQPKPAPVIDRLPAWSQKVLTWDGTLWSGTLTVPGIAVAFTFVAPNEKGCFHGLHAMWEDHRKQATNGG